MAIFNTKDKASKDVVGTKYADIITGDVRDNNLMGGAGNDVLYGKGGNDYLDGGSGSDFLQGGTGNDLLVGWTAADVFVFDRGHGHDLIADFNRAEGDRLAFDGDVRPISAANYDTYSVITTLDVDGVFGSIRLEGVTNTDWMLG